MSTVSLRTSHATLAGLRTAPFWLGIAQRLNGVVDLLLTWHERARQRRQLQGLSDHMLRDLALARADVEAEAAKPFWRP